MGKEGRLSHSNNKLSQEHFFPRRHHGKRRSAGSSLFRLRIRQVPVPQEDAARSWPLELRSRRCLRSVLILQKCCLQYPDRFLLHLECLLYAGILVICKDGCLGYVFGRMCSDKCVRTNAL